MGRAAIGERVPAPAGTPGTPPQNQPDRRRYVTPDQLAADLNRIFDAPITTRTLARWRSEKRGPAYVKVGRNVRYAVRDVEAWVQQQTRNNGGPR